MVDALVERADGRIAWAQRQVTLLVHNVSNAPGAAALGAETDVLGLIAWLCREQLAAALSREIDAEADDASALDDKTRAEKLTEISADLLATERMEGTLVWAAQAQGHAVSHREDCSPLALLGVELLVSTARPEPQSGSSPQWASRGRG